MATKLGLAENIWTDPSLGLVSSLARRPGTNDMRQKIMTNFFAASERVNRVRSTKQGKVAFRTVRNDTTRQNRDLSTWEICDTCNARIDCDACTHEEEAPCTTWLPEHQDVASMLFSVDERAPTGCILGQRESHTGGSSRGPTSLCPCSGPPSCLRSPPARLATR